MMNEKYSDESHSCSTTESENLKTVDWMINTGRKAVLVKRIYGVFTIKPVLKAIFTVNNIKTELNLFIIHSS